MRASTSKSVISGPTASGGLGWVIFTRGTPRLLSMRLPVSDRHCTSRLSQVECIRATTRARDSSGETSPSPRMTGSEPPHRLAGTFLAGRRHQVASAKP